MAKKRKTTLVVVSPPDEIPDGETPPAVDYDAMDYETLHAVLKTMIAEMHNATMFLRTIKRDKLLPAMDALKRKTEQPGRRIPIPGKPNFTEACHLLGMTPELVAVWRHRTETDDTLYEMIGGEKRVRKGAAAIAASRKLPPIVVKLVKAMLDDKVEEAEMLAQAIAEEFEI